MRKQLILFTSLCVLTQCATPTVETPTVSAHEIEREGAVQKQQSKTKTHADEQEILIPRATLEATLRRVGTRITEAGKPICESLARNTCDYEFVLDNTDKTANAYADGNRILVTPSMMVMTGDDATLAFVLSHEYAHNALAHGTASQHNGLLGGAVGLVLDGLLATQGINTGGDFARLGHNVGGTSYSVAFEREADYVGLYIAMHAGYPIQNAPNLWRRMSINNPSAIYNTSSHPSNAERFVAMQKTIEEIQRKKQQHASLLPEMHEEK